MTDTMFVLLLPILLSRLQPTLSIPDHCWLPQYGVLENYQEQVRRPSYRACANWCERGEGCEAVSAFRLGGGSWQCYMLAAEDKKYLYKKGEDEIWKSAKKECWKYEMDGGIRVSKFEKSDTLAEQAFADAEKAFDNDYDSTTSGLFQLETDRVTLHLEGVVASARVVLIERPTIAGETGGMSLWVASSGTGESGRCHPGTVVETGLDTGVATEYLCPGTGDQIILGMEKGWEGSRLVVLAEVEVYPAGEEIPTLAPTQPPTTNTPTTAPNAIVTEPIGPISGVESGGSDPILLYAGIGAGAGVLIFCCLISAWMRRRNTLNKGASPERQKTEVTRVESLPPVPDQRDYMRGSLEDVVMIGKTKNEPSPESTPASWPYPPTPELSATKTELPSKPLRSAHINNLSSPRAPKRSSPGSRPGVPSAGVKRSSSQRFGSPGTNASPRACPAQHVVSPHVVPMGYRPLVDSPVSGGSRDSPRIGGVRDSPRIGGVRDSPRSGGSRDSPKLDTEAGYANL